MSKHLVTHTFDQTVLDARISNAMSFYYGGDYRSLTDPTKVLSAVVQVSADYPAEWIDKIAHHLAEGYVRKPGGFTNVQHTSVGVYILQCDLVKPEHLHAADIEFIKAEVEAAYNEERRQAYEAHKATIVAESLERARRAEIKKAAEAEAKLIAKLEREATEALGGDFA